MNTYIDVSNIPVGGSVIITNADGSVGGYVKVTKRDAYDLRATSVIILVAVAVMALILLRNERNKTR